jgi:uncharacterized membrane protein YjgN (DUF898 family)
MSRGASPKGWRGSPTRLLNSPAHVGNGGTYLEKYKLVCKVSFGDMLGFIILWTILSIVTIGLALPFFAFYLLKLMIDRTEVVPIS